MEIQKHKASRCIANLNDFLLDFRFDFSTDVDPFGGPKRPPKRHPKSLKSRPRRPRAAQRLPGNPPEASREPFWVYFCTRELNFEPFRHPFRSLRAPHHTIEIIPAKNPNSEVKTHSCVSCKDCCRGTSLRISMTLEIPILSDRSLSQSFFGRRQLLALFILRLPL